MQCLVVAIFGGHKGGIFKVRKHNGPERTVHLVFVPGRFRGRIIDSPQERLNDPRIDFDNLVGNISMGFIMSRLDRFLVGSLNQTEGGTLLFIKPVSEKFYPLFTLRFQVFLMCIGDCMMRCPLDKVAVHKNRHISSQAQNGTSLSATQ